MERVIQGLEYDIALAYIDDVIVFGPTLDLTMDRIVIILERMRAAKLVRATEASQPLSHPPQARLRLSMLPILGEVIFAGTALAAH